MLKLAKNLILISAVTGLTACVKGGTISSDGSSTASGTITVSAVYPTAEGVTWTPIVDAADQNRIHIKGLAVTITGICSRGLTKVMVAGYTEEGTCLADGSFTWSRTFTSGQQGDAVLALTGYDLDGAAVSTATASARVRIDATAPAALAITTPASTPYTHANANPTFQIQGTCSADTVKITGPSGVEITPSGTNWTYDATLIAGSTLSFTFYAYDLAGNQSTSTTQVIEWLPSINIKSQGVIPGSATITHGGSGLKLEASVQSFAKVVNDNGASGMKLELGHNYITKRARD